MLQGNRYYILVSPECLEQLFKSESCRKAGVLRHFTSSTWFTSFADRGLQQNCTLAACCTTDRCLLHPGGRCHPLNHRTKSALGRSPTHTESLSQCCLAHEKTLSQKVLEDLAKTSFTSHALLCQTHQAKFKARFHTASHPDEKFTFFFKQRWNATKAKRYYWDFLTLLHSAE